ncbi:MAG: chorismate mutase [Candidatus Ancillula sp.]|jgi:chorismate mutase|nr:chorismate mutase [Candidatus Ancillula sp.]
MNIDDLSAELALELSNLRAEIDEIDDEILYLLSKRFSITEEVGKFKAEHRIEDADPIREAKQYKRMKRLSKELALPDGLEKEIWGVIMKAVKHRHGELKDVV